MEDIGTVGFCLFFGVIFLILSFFIVHQKYHGLNQDFDEFRSPSLSSLSFNCIVPKSYKK